MRHSLPWPGQLTVLAHHQRYWGLNLLAIFTFFFLFIFTKKLPNNPHFFRKLDTVKKKFDSCPCCTDDTWLLIVYSSTPALDTCAAAGGGGEAEAATLATCTPSHLGLSPTYTGQWWSEHGHTGHGGQIYSQANTANGRQWIMNNDKEGTDKKKLIMTGAEILYRN